MTKIVTITLGPDGEPTEGWIIIGYSPVGGGRTDIGAAIKANPDGSMPSWQDVAAILYGNLGRPEWPDFIKSNVSGNAVRMACPDGLETLVFSAAFNPTLDQSGTPIQNPPFVTIAEETFGAQGA